MLKFIKLTLGRALRIHENSVGLSSTTNPNLRGNHPTACSGKPILRRSPYQRIFRRFFLQYHRGYAWGKIYHCNPLNEFFLRLTFIAFVAFITFIAPAQNSSSHR